MAIQCKVVLSGGVEVVDAYVRTSDVPTIKKDRVGTDGIYGKWVAEAYKDKATADANGERLPITLSGTIKNLETLDVPNGVTNMVTSAFYYIYEDIKVKIVANGWEISKNDIEDV